MIPPPKRLCDNRRLFIGLPPGFLVSRITQKVILKLLGKVIVGPT